jgi:hypothetical protein
MGEFSLYRPAPPNGLLLESHPPSPTPRLSGTLVTALVTLDQR